MKKTYISPATTIVNTVPSTMIATSARNNYQVDFGNGHIDQGKLSLSGKITGEDGGESDTRRHYGSGLWED